MIKKVFLFFFLFNSLNHVYASVENKIINNFKKINNISFNFKQTINDKKNILIFFFNKFF